MNEEAGGGKGFYGGELPAYPELSACSAACHAG